MDIVCFSHLRWDFVYQRPQHILTRLSKHFRVFYVEEPVFEIGEDSLLTSQKGENVWVVQPYLAQGLSFQEISERQVDLLRELFTYMDVNEAIAWFYTPMALGLKKSLDPALIVFDCMDELSAFKNAPFELKQKEQDLLDIADIVFTGGLSLYEAKRDRHNDVSFFPSSIDHKHFSKARTLQPDPYDQQDIPHPRIGFFGVIDERMDIRLLSDIASRKPDWHFVFLGPVVKIDPATLPSCANIHYLGAKSYKELPHYIAGWEVAMMPFAINESTRYISPTKTPEYLAAGKPVVSTPIHDVVVMYGVNGVVYIAGNTNDFISAIERGLNMENPKIWLKAVDALLEHDSWDLTCEKMLYQINTKLENNKQTKDRLTPKEDEYV